MTCRAGAFLLLIACLTTSAAAQERVTIATTRDVANGALFLAAARGYFKAEGLDLVMRAYPDPPAAAEALGMGATDLALTAFGATAFTLAGSGKIKAIAAQVREQSDYEGNEIVASVAAFNRGLHAMADLANKLVGLEALGSPFHYQLAVIAERNSFSLNTVTLESLGSFKAVAQAVATNKVDAVILPPLYARELLMESRARFIGWCSALDNTQLGALFASAQTLAKRRAMVEKFLRAYRRGAADYAAALLRRDSYSKRVFDVYTHDAAAAIGLYLYPGRPASSTVPVVASAAYFMDADARLDLAELDRQLAWYKAQGLIDKSIDARKVVDLTFIK